MLDGSGVWGGLSLIACVAAAPSWVSVSTSTGAACPLEERLVSSFERAGLDVRRGRVPADAPHPSDVHVEVLKNEAGAATGVALEFGSKSETIQDIRFDALRTALSERLGMTLLPAPPAANVTALSALCRGDAQAAYDASGAAVTRSVARRLTPPKRFSQVSLHARWASATAYAREDKCSVAVGRLRRVIADISKNRLGPLWRRPPPAQAPSSIASFNNRIVVFEAGRFVGLDQQTGAPAWQLEAGVAEPLLIEVNDRRGIAVLSDALIYIDTDSGRVLWKASLPSPQSELVIDRSMIFAASRKEVVGLDRQRGTVVWRHDALQTPAAGPVKVGDRLVAPLYDHIAQLEPATGKVLSVTKLDDEISGPLIPAPPDAVWALLGSDRLVQVHLPSGKINYRTDRATGIQWPTVAMPNALIVGFPGRRPKVGFFDPSGSDRPQLLQSGSSPVLLRKDFQAIVHGGLPGTLVSRNDRGKILWRTRVGRGVRDVKLTNDAVVVAADSSVQTLDQIKGRTLRRFDLDGPVLMVTNDRFGGAVLMTDGTIYGLPSARDPRPAGWLTEARLELADCQAKLKQRSAAVRTAKEVLLREPKQRRAWSLIFENAPRKSDRLQAGLTLYELATQTKERERIKQQLQTEYDLVLLRAVEGLEDIVLTSSATAVVRTRDKAVVGIDLTTGRETFKSQAQTIDAAPLQFVLLDGSATDSLTGRPMVVPEGAKKPALRTLKQPAWLEQGRRLGRTQAGRFAGRWLVVTGPKPEPR